METAGRRGKLFVGQELSQVSQTWTTGVFETFFTCNLKSALQNIHHNKQPGLDQMHNSFRKDEKKKETDMYVYRYVK